MAFDAEKWRAWHRKRGERYAWRKAVPSSAYNPTGNSYTRGTGPQSGHYLIAQTVNNAWRALVHTTTRAVESPEFGLIEAGATEFSVMPDEVYVGRDDEITLLDRLVNGKAVLKRGAGSSDALPNAPVVSIVAVHVGETAKVAGTDYELDGDSIAWLDNAPDEGDSYAIEYLYNPTYVCLGASPDRLPRPAKDGALMPLRVLLTLKVIGDN